MGQELLKFFEQAEVYGRIKGRVKLATLTSISSWRAVNLPDSPELLQMFQNALEIVKNEFKSEKKANYSRNILEAKDLKSINLINLNSLEAWFLLEKDYIMKKTNGFSHSYKYSSN